jgi:hypothetical protein
VDDIPRLAADLGRYLDGLPAAIGASPVRMAERHGRNATQVRVTRREQLEQHVGTMTAAQRLRLAGALHLLSTRLDDDLAHPAQRAAA